MSTTTTYARMHNALAYAASEHRLKPFDVRLLVALNDRDGTARSDQVQEDMTCEGSQIRRSSGKLRERRFITARAADGSPEVKRGVRAEYRLTPGGVRVAVRVHELIRAMGEEGDAKA